MKKLLTLLVCAALLLSTCCSLVSCDSRDYQKALDLLEQGDYVQAKALFESLGDYKDAELYLSRFHYILSTLHVESEEGPVTARVSPNEQGLPARYWVEGRDTDYEEYTYDEKGNIIRTTIAEGEEEIETYDYTYDENGILIQEVQSSASSMVTTDYSYDEDGRLIEERMTTRSGYTCPVYYTYDENGNLIKMVSKMSEDFQITKEYTYDENGNLLTETSYYSEDSRTVHEYFYDENGNEIKNIGTYPDGTTEMQELTYDENGHLVKLLYSYVLDGVTYEETFLYTNDAYGNILTREHTTTEGVWEKLRMEYTLVYIPMELPEDTLSLIESFSEF